MVEAFHLVALATLPSGKLDGLSLAIEAGFYAHLCCLWNRMAIALLKHQPQRTNMSAASWNSNMTPLLYMGVALHALVFILGWIYQQSLCPFISPKMALLYHKVEQKGEEDNDALGYERRYFVRKPRGFIPTR